MAEGYLPRTLSDRLMNESLLPAQPGPGSNVNVLARLGGPEVMLNHLKPDRGKSLKDRIWPEPSIGEGVEYAANILGVPGLRGIRAYHGSPHKFDKFDSSRIGTGEGAQAYGHGLYFAENEGVARGYRDALTQNSGQVQVQTQYRDGIIDNSPRTFERFTAARLRENRGDVAAATRQLEADLAKNPDDKTVQQALNFIRTEGAKFKVNDFNPGHMYEVNINARPEQFLDWDKPLTKQSQQAQDAFKTLGFEPNANKYPSLKQAENLFQSYRVQKDAYDDIGVRESLRRGYGFVRAGDKAGFEKWFDAHGGSLSPGRHKDIQGQDLYYELGNRAGIADPSASFRARYPQASAQLNDAGIPGIKYLDQGSRGAGQGSSNYVVFNDAIVDILKRYGIAGGALPLAAGFEARDFQ